METTTPPPRLPWGLLLAASGILMLTMAARQTTGLFVEPIHRDTGIGIVEISFALAIGQFVWGAVQPLFGALADQRGPLPVLVGGGLVPGWRRCRRPPAWSASCSARVTWAPCSA